MTRILGATLALAAFAVAQTPSGNTNPTQMTMPQGTQTPRQTTPSADEAMRRSTVTDHPGTEKGMEMERRNSTLGKADRQTFTGFLLDASCSGLQSLARPDSVTADMPTSTPQRAMGDNMPRRTGETAQPQAGNNSPAGQTDIPRLTEMGRRDNTTMAGDPNHRSQTLGTAQPAMNSDMPRSTVKASSTQTDPPAGCMASSTTKQFALFSDGKVMRMDDRSNELLANQIAGNQK